MLQPPPPALPTLQCSGFFVASQILYWRANPRFTSLLRMVPCDLWRALRGRQLWLIGDSQAQRFHRQMSCFLEPFILPEAYWPEPDWRPQGQRLSSDPRCDQVGMPRCVHTLQWS